MTVFDADAYRNVCIRHNLFTCGTNRQYEKVMMLIQKGITIDKLAALTFICSADVFSLAKIKNILSNEL